MPEADEQAMLSCSLSERLLLFDFGLLQKKTDEMFEDAVMELFPEGYSTGAFSTADSGKLLVLTDLLSVIQEVNHKDRYTHTTQIHKLIIDVLFT